MSWSLAAKADVREIGGALRLEYDRLVHLSGGAVLGDAEHVAVNAALAAVNQVATSGALGTSGVGVVISGHTPLDGRPEGATVSMVLSGYSLEPHAIGPVEGRPASRFRHTLEEGAVPETTDLPDDDRPHAPANPFGPGVEVGEPRGQTDSAAFLAAQGEAIAIERDRNDDEQIRARREEAIKLQREAAAHGTVAGADIVIGPERRPNDPVTQAQEQRDRELVEANDPDAFSAPAANPNEAFLGEVQTAANPDATGEPIPGPDGEPEVVTPEDMLAQPPPGAEATVGEVTSTDDGDDEDDPGEVTKARLQELADEHEIPRSGTKAEIRARLDEAGVEVTEAG